MKRLTNLKVLVLVVAATGMVFGGVWATDVSESSQTMVSWNVSGCWIGLKIHKNVDLGTITGPGQILESTSGNEVFVRTNCPRGYGLAIQAADALTPAGFTGNILADFEWKVVKATGNVSEYQDTYTSFSDFGEVLKVGLSERPGVARFQMAYKYTSDDDDIPGEYNITLVYTATAR